MADSYIQCSCDICFIELSAFFDGKNISTSMSGHGTLNRIVFLTAHQTPAFLSERDSDFLSSAGIHTVIDLRNEAESLKAPSSFADMPQFDYHCIPIEEGSGIPKSASAVPESYMEIAAAANIGRIFRLMAHSRNGVLFHCAAGKDRTGVISAILLMLAGVNDEEIVLDYILTKEYNRERLETARLKYSDEIMDIITPKEEYITDFLQLFREKYGNIENYFASVGISAKEVYMLKDRLLEET